MGDRGVLLEMVDRMGAKVTWVRLQYGGWKCIVSGIALPPHAGIGSTPLRALSDVIVLAGRLGWP